MHVPLRSHESKDAALQYFSGSPQPSLQPRIITLNSDTGDWRFRLFDKPESVTKDFWESKFDSSEWEKVLSISQAFSIKNLNI